MRENLIKVLSSVGKPTESCQSPDGSTVLMLPYGGRILGLFAPQCDENFLWTNPALASVFFQGTSMYSPDGLTEKLRTMSTDRLPVS